MTKLAYDYEEAAEATGVSKRVLQNALRNNELVAVYPTSKPVFLAAELQRWLEAFPNQRP